MIMDLQTGATFEINSRWPEHKQRNAALMPEIYGRKYTDNLTIGIQLVRDRYHELKNRGETQWSSTPELAQMLDALVIEN